MDRPHRPEDDTAPAAGPTRLVVVAVSYESPDRQAVLEALAAAATTAVVGYLLEMDVRTLAVFVVGAGLTWWAVRRSMTQ